jgi:hypothetical protein
MDNPTEYRRYAEECERMAREGPPEHGEVLLAIAKAWRDCALRAESSEAPSLDGD